MSDQSPFNRAIRFATAVALLAAVMTSPIRPVVTALATGTPQANYLRRDVTGSPQVHYLDRNFGVPGKASTTHHRPHAPVTSRVVQVKAVSSQHTPDWTSDPARHRAGPPQAPSLEAGRQSTVVDFDRTVHPLRC
jgi:hypothetical protein